MANFSFPSGSTLKALLEDPNLQVAPVPYNNSNKLKQEKEGGDGANFDLASAAFLGPSLWDKTYDNADFNLEYMDLDEFLMENNTQAWTDQQALSPPMPGSSSTSPPHVSPPRVSPVVPPVVSPQASPRAAPPSPPQVSSELAAALMQIPAPEPKTYLRPERGQG